MNVQHQRLEEHVNVNSRGLLNTYVLSWDSTNRRWNPVPNGADQNIDGGKADSVYTPPQLVDGGNA